MNFLIAEHQSIRSEVEFSKRQQLAITNYTLILFGAIIGLYMKFGASIFSAVIIFALSLFILAISICFLKSCQISQENNNAIIKEIRCKFPVYDKITKGVKKKKTYSDHIIYAYSGILVIGFMAVLYTLLKL